MKSAATLDIIKGESEQCFRTAPTLSGLLGGHRLPDQDFTTRLIPLTQDQFAIVDAADFEWLNQWKWCAQWIPATESFYAVRSEKENSKRIRIYMHRLILGCGVEELGDHENGNTLDCRRSNLRLCTKLQNNCNRGIQSNNTSGFKGVSLVKDTGKWKAQISINGKRISLGCFALPEEAARAYDSAAIKEFGDFAKLNFPILAAGRAAQILTNGDVQ